MYYISPEHGSELLRDALKDLLDGSGVADEGGGHLQSTGRNVTHGSLYIIGDPFDEVAAILVLDVQHLLVHFLHGHAPTENGGDGQVTPVSRIASSHHVLQINHQLLYNAIIQQLIQGFETIGMLRVRVQGSTSIKTVVENLELARVKSWRWTPSTQALLVYQTRNNLLLLLIF